jgi:hypothetical protein
VNGDGFDDVIIGAPDEEGRGAAFVSIADTLPVRAYSSDLGAVRLRQTWTPHLGDPFVVTGTIRCEGSSLVALGIHGVSLAPTNFLLFGFPLLIADDPINLIDTGGFGFASRMEFGHLIVPNVSRQIPFIAGSMVYIQFFETSPVPSASSALSMLLVP